MFHHDSSTRWSKLSISKICNKKVYQINQYIKYVSDKNQNARVCAKWQWKAVDWCYWIAFLASPGVCFTVIWRTPVRSRCRRSRPIAPQNNKGLGQGILHIWSKVGDPSFNDGPWVIAQTGKWLTHTDRHTHTHTHTDAGNDNTRGPRVNTRSRFCLCCLETRFGFNILFVYNLMVSGSELSNPYLVLV